MSKRYQEALKNRPTESCSPLDAISYLKSLQQVKFDQSVEMHFNLNIDPRHADQMVRGTFTLPHGTGKDIKIICITKSEDVEELKKQGANEVGSDDLIEKIKSGWLDFDLVLATPDSMVSISKVARILGPRGLMPSQKNGTITTDLKSAVSSFKAGKIEYKNDKTGNLHLVIGKSSFDNKKLIENFTTAYDTIIKAKPSSAKGVFVKSLSLCFTMSPSVFIDENNLNSQE